MTILKEQKVRWRLLSKHLFFWLSAEIFLGIVGLDNLADCVEYLLNRQRLIVASQPVCVNQSI
ncbi:MAG: hypothetical protein AAF959_00545 [Cyanobacteria bacterium P01_D01_bin.56]